MYNRLFILLVCLLLSVSLRGQQNDPYDQRGVQFATQGTDFWVCFPRTFLGTSANMARLYVVSERDCDVTVTNPLLDYQQTVHIMRREMCGPDTNFIEIPFSVSYICDTIDYSFPTEYDKPYVGRTADHPQARGFHVTSTDTISLFLWVRSWGTSGACNVFPTELLRDEYVVQTPPLQRQPDYDYVTPLGATVDIVAIEDNTVVDIVLSDWDWLNRHPGDTITVTLQRGELYHFAGGEVREKYYPWFAPYWRPDTLPLSSPRVRNRMTVGGHSFSTFPFTIDTFMVDLSGTRIKARDCKRIAVFEGGGASYIPERTGTGDMLLEQSLPTKFAGTEFLVPNLDFSDTDFVRITGLHDGTRVTVYRGAQPGNNTRTLTVDAYKTEWFAILRDDGPLYITPSEPAIVKTYLMRSYQQYVQDLLGGDPSFYAVTPVEWWHNGQINFGTITDVDAQHNRQIRRPSLYVFTRTEDVASIWSDSYSLENDFTPIINTPYSCAFFDYRSRYVSQGTHRIYSTTGAEFMAVMASAGEAEQISFNLPHVQPGNTFLLVNDIPSDSLKEDSIWCMYDPITFHAWDERPADSMFWDFGDGTTFAFSHLDNGFQAPQTHRYQDTGKYRVMCVFTYEYDSCFTIPPDTLWAPIWIHNHYDSAFSVHLCEGTFTFRGHLLDYTDTHYITTYWTPSGCDTLWQIDFVTCPHCSWDYDTIAPSQLPWEYNGYTFGGTVHDEPLSIDIGDDCDSIIFYTLIVVPHWGEPPIDSVFILAPNVITPLMETNNRFALSCSHHILKAEVSIFNRMGTRVAQFDGLTGSWDGTSDGRPCHQGAYVYFVRYIDTKDNSWKTIKGTVTLVY